MTNPAGIGHPGSSPLGWRRAVGFGASLAVLISICSTALAAQPTAVTAESPWLAKRFGIEHFDSDRDPNSNPNCSPDPDANRQPDPDANRSRNSHTNGSPDPDANRQPDPDANRQPNPDANRAPDSNPNRAAHADTQPQNFRH